MPKVLETDESEAKMQKYKCSVCGYVYDPSMGDKLAGIDYGTPFEELPKSWRCPVCGAKKSKFKPLEETEAPSN